MSEHATPPTTEFGLIEWIRRNVGKTWTGTAQGIGDDCAVLNVESGTGLLVTTDMLLDGRHFLLERDGPEAVGYKAMGVNLSDIAAMAGIPRAAVVSVALPRSGGEALARGLLGGIRAMADPFDVDVIGGDTNAWNGPLVINIALLGEATSRGAVLRSGARPGDQVFVTGPLGGSLHRGRHLRPEPRVREALAMHRRVPLRALIDVSDGISSDLGHVLQESGGLGAVLDGSAIPVHADAKAQAQADGIPALSHALHDGEDFELCVVLSPEDARTILADTPKGVTLYRIGEITAEPGMRLLGEDGALSNLVPGGFDHFRDAEP